MMHDQAAARLQALRQEYETGQRMLADLETRQLELQQTLLRVSGAIQVLEELLADAGPAAGDRDTAAPSPDGPVGDRLVEADAEA